MRVLREAALVESLAVIAGLVFLAVVLSGPVAYLLWYSGYPYMGGTLGIVAIVLGVWWACTVRTQIAWAGLASAAVGLYVALQVRRRYSPE